MPAGQMSGVLKCAGGRRAVSVAWLSSYIPHQRRTFLLGSGYFRFTKRRSVHDCYTTLVPLFSAALLGLTIPSSLLCNLRVWESLRGRAHRTWRMKSSTHPVMKFPRSAIATFILGLGMLAIVYQLLDRFPSLSSSIGSTIRPLLPSSSANSCTKDIGEGLCCELFLEAEPCTEECRKVHLDRETFTLTKEYETCAEKCLVDYNGLCESGRVRRTEVGRNDAMVGA